MAPARRSPLAATLSTMAALALIAGCGSAGDQASKTPPAGSSSLTSAGTSAGAGATGSVVVTVPALLDSGAASPGVGTSPGAIPGQVTSGAPSTSPLAPTTVVTGPPTSSGPASSAPIAAGPPIITTTVGTPTSSGPPSTGTSGGSTVAVDLAGCSGCSVVASRAGVASGLGAALVSTGPGAALLSVRADGSRVGVINVPYGSSFPRPAGGVLACDSGARCVVVGRQSDGTAILSAFLLGADGTWRDVSGSGGFPSATGVGAAADLDGDGRLELVVQEALADGVGWIVFAWAGDRYTVRGCAPVVGSALPAASDLSPNDCSS